MKEKIRDIIYPCTAAKFFDTKGGMHNDSFNKAIDAVVAEITKPNDDENFLDMIIDAQEDMEKKGVLTADGISYLTGLKRARDILLKK